MPDRLPAPRSCPGPKQALRCLTLTGPTASGKSAAALAIAQRWPVEIISVDSALVYKGMDIGTAKPSVAELAQVPHHLINIREPTQPYSAAEFVADATALMGQINARGRVALLVGGTMLYLHALMRGIDDMPQAHAAVRQRIQARALAQGWPALHAELARVDAPTAARLSPFDAQRIQRALEVFELSGRPISDFQHAAHRPHTSVLASGALISLEPHERSWLHQRIEQRFEAMLRGGFLGEVAQLRARGDLGPDMPAMRCVGYRQAWEMLDGAGVPWAGLKAQEQHALLRQRVTAATRQLAKRQLTWLRSMPERQTIACDAPDALHQVLHHVHAALGAPAS